jgi:hypothetical protein
MVIRKIQSIRALFGHNRPEVMWSKLHDEEHLNIHFPPNTIQPNKLRMMRWARNVAP